MSKIVLLPESINKHPTLASFIQDENVNHAEIVSTLQTTYEVQKQDERDEFICKSNITPLKICAILGKTKQLQLLLKADLQRQNIQHHDYEQAIIYTACNGHIDALRVLLEIPDGIGALATRAGYAASVSAVRGGQPIYLEILRILLSYDETMQSIAAHENEDVSLLMEATDSNNLDAVKLILTYPNLLLNIKNDLNLALRIAVSKGFKAIESVLLQCPVVQDSMASEENSVLWCVVKCNRIDLVEYLLTYNSVVANLAWNQNAIFKLALEKKHYDIATRLLHYPAVYVVLDGYVAKEHMQFFHDFVHEHLKKIKSAYLAHQTAFPGSTFDVANEDVQLLVYMIMFLIYRHEPIDEWQFLLQLNSIQPILISHMQNLSYWPVYNVTTELLLLNIPKIWDIFVQKGFGTKDAYYAHHVWPEISKYIPKPLSKEERKPLIDLYSRYMPQIDSLGGVDNIIVLFQEYVSLRYHLAPAVFTNIAGELVSLPISWDAFNQLAIADIDKKNALAAYYANHWHGAYRFLLATDVWRLERNFHGNFLDINRAFKTLFAIFWMAAKDSRINSSCEKRIVHFMKTVAEMARTNKNDTLPDVGLTIYACYRQLFHTYRKGLYEGLITNLMRHLMNEIYIKKISTLDNKDEIRMLRLHMLKYFIKNTHGDSLNHLKLTPEEITLVMFNLRTHYAHLQLDRYFPLIEEFLTSEAVLIYTEMTDLEPALGSIISDLKQFGLAEVERLKSMVHVFESDYKLRKAKLDTFYEAFDNIMVVIKHPEHAATRLQKLSTQVPSLNSLDPFIATNQEELFLFLKLNTLPTDVESFLNALREKYGLPVENYKVTSESRLVGGPLR